MDHRLIEILEELDELRNGTGDLNKMDFFDFEVTEWAMMKELEQTLRDILESNTSDLCTELFQSSR